MPSYQNCHGIPVKTLIARVKLWTEEGKGDRIYTYTTGAMKTVPMKMLSFAPNSLHTLILRLLKASKVYLSDLNKTREEHEKEDKRVGYIPLNSLSSPLETTKKKNAWVGGDYFLTHTVFIDPDIFIHMRQHWNTSDNSIEKHPRKMLLCSEERLTLITSASHTRYGGLKLTFMTFKFTKS